MTNRSFPFRFRAVAIVGTVAFIFISYLTLNRSYPKLFNKSKGKDSDNDKDKSKDSDKKDDDAENNLDHNGSNPSIQSTIISDTNERNERNEENSTLMARTREIATSISTTTTTTTITTTADDSHDDDGHDDIFYESNIQQELFHQRNSTNGTTTDVSQRTTVNNTLNDIHIRNHDDNSNNGDNRNGTNTDSIRTSLLDVDTAISKTSTVDTHDDFISAPASPKQEQRKEIRSNSNSNNNGSSNSSDITTVVENKNSTSIQYTPQRSNQGLAIDSKTIEPMYTFDNNFSPNTNELRRFEYLTSLIEELSYGDDIMLIIETIDSVITALTHPNLGKKNAESFIELGIISVLDSLYSNAILWSNYIVLKSSLRLTQCWIESQKSSVYNIDCMLLNRDSDILNYIIQLFSSCPNELIKQDAYNLLSKIIQLRNENYIKRIVTLEAIPSILSYLSDLRASQTVGIDMLLTNTVQDILSNLLIILQVDKDDSDVNFKKMLEYGMNKELEELKLSMNTLDFDLKNNMLDMIQNINHFYLIH